MGNKHCIMIVNSGAVHVVDDVTYDVIELI